MTTRPAEHIPFVNTEKDCQLLSQHFSDSTVARLSFENYQKVKTQLPQNMGVWIDPGFDVLDRIADGAEPDTGQVALFGSAQSIKSVASGDVSNKRVVEEMVRSVLNKVKAERSAWISIPQLALVEDSARNKINRLLAQTTRTWAAEQGYRGKLILPIVVTHQRQINKKTDRDPKVKQAKACYELAGANGFWLVESSLYDQDGAGTFDTVRFPALVRFHQEINAVIPTEAISIGGPYWGLNLVLWAKGLIRFPAIGLGNSFQYHIPGGHLQQGSARVALGPLKRLAVMSSELKQWLTDSLAVVPTGDAAHATFQQILRNFDRLQSQESRTQIARFYKDWFDRIAATPAPGRALALYQDFSSAYVLGKGLPELPATEKTARRPERVAQQLMMTCL
jgi:hypothetical protein